MSVEVLVLWINSLILLVSGGMNIYLARRLREADSEISSLEFKIEALEATPPSRCDPRILSSKHPAQEDYP